MKKNLRFLMLTLLCAVFSTAWGETITDELTKAFIGVEGSSYTNWSGKEGASGAVYAGNSSGGDNKKTYIQLRSNTNCGIITTSSGGKVKSVTISWNDATANGRTLDVYGKGTKYTASSDLYDSSTETKGTKLGSIEKGSTTTTLNISGDYAFIGLRSNSGAMYIDKIEIEWVSSSTPVVTFGNPNPTAITLGASGEFELGVTPADGVTVNDYSLSWVSSNQENFALNGATYSANAEGTFTITVTASTTKEGYMTATKQFSVTVTGVDPGLQFSSSFLSLEKNTTGNISFSKTTTANVTFSNDNPTVATYDPETGDITALAEGRAKITATTPQQGQYKAGTATLTIEVTDPNKEGGFNNPYTVQGLLDAEELISGDIYVKGYIVGAFVNNNFKYRQSDISVNAYTNTNIALADAANETDDSKVIPVELPSSGSGILRNLGAKIEGNVGIQVLLKAKNQTYFQREGLKGTTEAYIITNISSVGYSTAYYGNTALLVPEGTVAKTVKLGSDGKLVYTSVADNIIPAGTGVVLQGSGEQKLKVVSTDNTAPTNDLYGTDISTNELVTGNYYYYKLSLANDSTDPTTVGFYWGAEDGGMFTNGAHKAYMALPKPSASSYVFDETVGIPAISETVKSADGIYTLSGMKISGDQLPKGIYIVNGKKMVIK